MITQADLGPSVAYTLVMTRPHGQRLYDWAAVEIRPWREPGRGHWLLARRSITDPDEIAYYLCYGPADTELTELVRVAGARWAIEECLCATRRSAVFPV